MDIKFKEHFQVDKYTWSLQQVFILVMVALSFDLESLFFNQGYDIINRYVLSVSIDPVLYWLTQSYSIALMECNII